MDSIVERRKIRGVRAAAGVAGDGDAIRVDFLARQQVVEGADAVPDGVARQIIAGQKALNTKHRVLGRGAYDLGSTGVWIP